MATISSPFRRTSTLLFATLGRTHEWLPMPDNRPFPTMLGEALKQLGIYKVAFLRHGNAVSTSSFEGGIDFDRQLSDVGRHQVEEAAHSFGEGLMPFYAKVFVSPAPRTKETLKIFLTESGADLSQHEIIEDDLLYDGTMQPQGNALFRKLGYAPLATYLNATEKGDRLSARKVLGSYAYKSTKLLMDIVMKDLLKVVEAEELNEEQPEVQEEGTTLLVVGHAIYLPAVALSLASVVGCGANPILSTSIDEASGVLVDLKAQRVDILNRPYS